MADNKSLRLYDESGRFVRVSVDELISNKLNYWKGWCCSAGVSHLYIDYDRNIFICNRASAEAIHKKWGPEWSKYVRDAKIKAENWEMSEEEIDVLRKEWNKKIQENPVFLNDIGYIGRVGERIQFPVGSITCPFDTCSCGADVVVSKSKGACHINNLTDDEMEITLDNISPIAVETNYPMPFQILWDLTRRCNYDCSYCWPYVHNKTDKFIPTDEAIDACEQFIFEWASGAQINFNFGGGEPTLHPGFIEIIKYLKENGQWILVTSNGSRSPNFWKEAIKYINNVNLSAHFESIDKERFLENLEVVAKGDHWIEVKLMAPPGRVVEALEFKDKIKVKCVCSLVPIRDLENSWEMVNYTDEELSLLQNQ